MFFYQKNCFFKILFSVLFFLTEAGQIIIFQKSKQTCFFAGFIPTLNFRYGKSYCKAADDSLCEYETNKHRRIQMAQEEIDRMFRAKSASRMTSIRSKDEIQGSLNEFTEKRRVYGKSSIKKLLQIQLMFQGIKSLQNTLQLRGIRVIFQKLKEMKSLCLIGTTLLSNED